MDANRTTCTLLLVGGIFLLAGCATSTYRLTDGDRTAGFVVFTCEYDLFTSSCEGDFPAMQAEADRACKNWGYVGATAFGGAKKIASDGGYRIYRDHEGNAVSVKQGNSSEGYYERKYQCVVE